MSRKTYKMVLSYDGAKYYGWQRQDKFLTVQGILEHALFKFFGADIKTFGAGRTDAGVHAYGQVVSFSADTLIPAKNFKPILNGLLPDDIRVMSVEDAPAGLNPRYNVKQKLYRYVICNSPLYYAVYNGRSWHIPEKLDVEKLRQAAAVLTGRHNFFSFSKAGNDTKEYTRTIDSIKVKKNGKWIILDFKGKSFLYNMVRRLTAIIVLYGQGQISVQDIKKMLETQDRALVRNTAPPQGLYLVKITYDKRNVSKRYGGDDEGDE
ncbi:MAG: tRNA pseudouridine(38-40) synthase TruA [Candidatus Goldbacteria bacterium]|nr:tRNA pseudouridine(38-40) synthase TruA [Candidatus Goldiibacteriota bacterium]